MLPEAEAVQEPNGITQAIGAIVKPCIYPFQEPECKLSDGLIRSSWSDSQNQTTLLWNMDTFIWESGIHIISDTVTPLIFAGYVSKKCLQH